MSRSELNRAIVAVAEQLRNSETVNISDAVIAPYGDVMHYVKQAAEAALRKDTEALKKNMRDAQRHGHSFQLSLPGMEHASLPLMVWDRDAETGEEFAVPTALARWPQIKAEIRRQRRSVNAQDRVVSGWEATESRAEELGVTDEWTGAEIEANFPKEIE